MMVLMMLRRHVLMPLLGIERPEFRERFRGRTQDLCAYLDASPAEAMANVGGFGGIIEEAHAWTRPLVVRCTGPCARTQAIDAFLISTNGSGQSCIHQPCRECGAAKRAAARLIARSGR
jgi:hypothetical protein